MEENNCNPPVPDQAHVPTDDNAPPANPPAPPPYDFQILGFGKNLLFYPKSDLTLHSVNGENNYIPGLPFMQNLNNNPIVPYMLNPHLLPMQQMQSMQMAPYSKIRFFSDFYSSNINFSIRLSPSSCSCTGTHSATSTCATTASC